VTAHRGQLQANPDLRNCSITVADFERGLTKLHSRTLTAIIAAFETAGIEFIKGGVRLRTLPKRTRPTGK
jgi:hypothetical protein